MSCTQTIREDTTTFEDLVVTSYNCKNLKSSINELKEICMKTDILLLQETWLLDSEAHLLNCLHKDFYAKGISAMDTSAALIRGRPHGGLAILWKKSLGSSCKVVDYDDPRIMGLEVNKESKSVLLVNIYMPYACHDNASNFAYYLSFIDSIIMAYRSPYVYVAGDFNSDLSLTDGQINQCFGKELVKFCDDQSFIISDQLMLDNDNAFTFYSEAHQSVSWLDHVVTTQAGHRLLTSMDINNDLVSSDHFPIIFHLAIENIPCLSSQGDSSRCRRINWSELSQDIKDTYKRKSADTLSSVPLDHGLLMCQDPSCADAGHIHAIDEMYKNIVQSLNEAGKCISGEKVAKSSFKPTPGWNDYVQSSHEEAREAFHIWQLSSKPKFGPVFDLMKTTRARFKYALRYCKSMESRARADALAKKLLTKDDVSFWKEVKKINGSGHHVLSDMVDNVSGEKDIADMWQGHYSDLLNSNKDTSYKKSVIDSLNHIPDYCDIKFAFTDIGKAIKSLKLGKSPGLDNLQAEHFKFADPALWCLIAMAINCMIMHGYLPDSAMDTLVIPILKDKKGLLQDKNNYRPVAITSVFSKILESIILDKYRDQLVSSDNQFGFKKGHSTDLCVFSLKQVIEFYHSLSSPVYVCFLDASKAFDRLNHWLLFHKLALRGIPIIVIRLFVYWYASQQFCVKWGNTFSCKFHITNGVRQGGIISPVFFNLYMDGLSKLLNNSSIGCTFNGKVVNHFMYADDSCIISPSPAGLQKLVDLCCVYADSNTLMYNELKTRCVCFKPKSLKQLSVPAIYLGTSELKFVSDIKYLGVMLNEEIKDDMDMARHKRYLYCKGNMLTSKFKDCSEEVKSRLFTTYCNNVYCGHLWTCYKPVDINKLTVAFNDIYRMLFNIKRGESMSTIYINNNMDCFKVLLRKAAFRFRTRLLNSDNVYVKLIINSVHFYKNSSLTNLWAKILFA